MQFGFANYAKDRMTAPFKVAKSQVYHKDLIYHNSLKPVITKDWHSG